MFSFEPLVSDPSVVTDALSAVAFAAVGELFEVSCPMQPVKIEVIRTSENITMIRDGLFAHVDKWNIYLLL